MDRADERRQADKAEIERFIGLNAALATKIERRPGALETAIRSHENLLDLRAIPDSFRPECRRIILSASRLYSKTARHKPHFVGHSGEMTIMATANEVQHTALVTLLAELPTIRRLSMTDITVPWSLRERLQAQSFLCHLDAYLTMLQQPMVPIDLGPRERLTSESQT